MERDEIILNKLLRLSVVNDALLVMPNICYFDRLQPFECIYAFLPPYISLSQISAVDSALFRYDFGYPRSFEFWCCPMLLFFFLSTFLAFHIGKCTTCLYVLLIPG